MDPLMLFALALLTGGVTLFAVTHILKMLGIIR